MTAPRLSLVPESTDAKLRASFIREDELVAELAKIRAEQRTLRHDYASERGLCMNPSMETVRKAVM